MDHTLSFLCLLYLLIAPGHSLSCVKCVGNVLCTGSSETCLSNYSCGLAYRETTDGGSSTTDFIRSCVPTSMCNKAGSISYTGGKMKLGISCCDTDNCTPPLPTLPADNSQVNGLSCPSCRSQTQSSCTPKTTVQCTGSEKTCISESTITAASESAMGCATSNICDVSSFTYSSADYNINMLFICLPASSNSVAETGTLCIVCSSLSSLTCTGSLSTAPSGYKCATAYKLAIYAGQTAYGVIRSWAPVSKCGITGTMTVINSNSRYLLGISCCNGDACTPIVPDSIAPSTGSNNVQCKTCYSTSSAYCEATNTLSCTGSESECVTYVATLTAGSSSATSVDRGCGTKSLCDVQSYVSTADTFGVEYKFICSSSPMRNGGIVFPLLSTAAVILILHLFNKDP